MAKAATPLEQRFWHHVPSKGDAGCWPWAGALNDGGYGVFEVGNRQLRQTRKVRAHRLAYELSIAPIRDDLTIDHLCRNRACVNPHHLEPVSKGENNRRGMAGALLRERHLAQTHCKSGHEFTPTNTYRRPDRGTRECRTCRSNAALRFLERSLT